MQTTETVSTREATERLVKIPNSNYAKADIGQVAANTTQLNAEEITQRIRLLNCFEDLFDSLLGYWDTYPTDLELNPYYKPLNCKYYPVTIIKNETFHKELQSLLKIGVLTLVQQFKYATQVFTIPKKEGVLGFITDYRRINQKLVRNMYPLHIILVYIIGETMQQLEAFLYATALYPNMGCYTIRISIARKDMTKIVTEFGKSKYNNISMVMCASGYIFQAKLDNMISYIEGAKIYIDDILVLSKDSLYKNI